MGTRAQATTAGAGARGIKIGRLERKLKRGGVRLQNWAARRVAFSVRV